MKSAEHNSKGRLIVIEGADGCGKTTQARLLADYLRQTHPKVLLVREPGGTAIGEEIRRVLLNPSHRAMSAATELLLYMACRSQLTGEIIKPALADGKSVICDRYLLSSVVYQGYAGGLGVDIVHRIGTFATENVEPDIQIVLDISYKTALRRRNAEPDTVKAGPKERQQLFGSFGFRTAKADRIEARGDLFNRKVIKGYKAVAKGMKNVHIIDGNRSVEEVQKDIRRIVAGEQR